MKAFASLLTLLFVFCMAGASPALSGGVAGSWKYSVDTPDGAYKGTMVFTQTAEGYSGKMTGQAGETALTDLKVEDNNVSFSLYVDGYQVKVKGVVNGDTFEGKVEVEYQFYPIKGERIMEDVLAGAWNYTASTPDGAAHQGKFVFAKSDAGYTGKMIVGEAETELKDVKLEGDQLSFSLQAQGYLVKVKGSVKGTTFEGKGEVEYEYFPVKAEKASE